MTTDAKHLRRMTLCAAVCWIVVLPTSSQFGKCADPIGRLARRVSDPGMQVLLSKIPESEFLDTSDTPLRGTKWLGTCRRLRFLHCDRIVQDLP